jgi:hypothetical protein
VLKHRDNEKNKGKQFSQLSFVQHRPQESLDLPIERFFTSLRFEQRGKLDQLGIKIGSFD